MPDLRPAGAGRHPRWPPAPCRARRFRVPRRDVRRRGRRRPRLDRRGRTAVLRSPPVRIRLAAIVLLLAAIGVTAALFRPLHRTAAAPLLPYLLWVAYATALNAAVWHLNP
ncbi:tryptophan-rich sensory protein [Streptomyces sp. NPDC085540]|uniref:tryptophan-rich sensory protein n=1 Tax=Streptomyces sp. NPDC085540 TaxID=3365730 RepID=UPI0037D4C6A5